MKKRKYCKTNGCKNPPKTRGVCPTCYQAALKIVKSGKASWETLEGFGLVTPPHVAGRKVSTSKFVIAWHAATALLNQKRLSAVRTHWKKVDEQVKKKKAKKP